MKIFRHWFGLLLAAPIFLPVAAPAQGTQVPPPPCCHRDSIGLVPLPTSTELPVMPQGETAAEAGITISEGMLRTLGLSRSEILDLLCDTLLAGKDVEVLFYRSQYVDPEAVIGLAGADPASDHPAGQAVSGAEVRILYRIPRPAPGQWLMDPPDHLYISDGRNVVEVTFRASQTTSAIR